MEVPFAQWNGPELKVQPKSVHFVLLSWANCQDSICLVMSGKLDVSSLQHVSVTCYGSWGIVVWTGGVQTGLHYYSKIHKNYGHFQQHNVNVTFWKISKLTKSNIFFFSFFVIGKEKFPHRKTILKTPNIGQHTRHDAAKNCLFFPFLHGLVFAKFADSCYGGGHFLFLFLLLRKLLTNEASDRGR